MNTEPTPPETVSPDRSPRCPRATLGESVEDVRKLHKAIGKSVVTPEGAAKGLGYKGTSGAALLTLGALSMYGLVSRIQGKVAITPLAIKILFPTSAQVELEAKQQAALNPKTFRDIWEQYNDMDKEVLAHQLIQWNFSAEGASRAAKVYKSNVEYAKLVKGEKIKVDPATESEDTEENKEEKPEVDPSKGKASGIPPKKNNAMLATFKIPVGLAEAEIVFTGTELDAEAFDALAEYIPIFKKQYERKLAAEDAEAKKIADGYMAGLPPKKTD